MHDVELIFKLTSGLAAALVFGYVTHRLGLSPIVGYLLAGIAVGPHTPGFVADQQLAEQFAEVGVILLMFGVGLQFHFDELLAVRRVALPGAVMQSAVATILGALIARAFGWNWSGGIVYGMAISVASTVVLTRVLADNRDLHTPAGHIAIGWLVVEDLFTVVMLVLLPVMFGGQGAPSDVPLAVAITLIKVSALVALALVVGGRVIPWLLAKAAMTRSRELFTLTVLVLALGIAVGSAKVFGVSMSLGAFLAGMVVGRSEFSLRAASDALPMRDAFAVLFFVSIGMLFNPASLRDSPGLLAASVAVIIVGKPAAALAITLVYGYPLRIALCVAVALAQIGEFSFILAAVGSQMGLLSSVATNTLISAAILSIAVNPLLYRAVDPFSNWVVQQRAVASWLRLFPRRHEPRAATPGSTQDAIAWPRHRAVVVGYGPVGRTVTRLLQENDVSPTVIEMNLDSINSLRNRGIAAVFGDASRRETLEAAGLSRAGSFILSAAGIPHTDAIIRLAKEISPHVGVLARAAYVAEMPQLRAAGADVVFSGEGEVALAFTVVVLSELGATPEQIDRERERVRDELLGPSA